MMMVYIKPLSRFPELSSDKIFGALTNVISEIYPELIDEMISSFESNNPPFLVSSAFPVILDDNKKIRCYPKINRFIESYTKLDYNAYRKYQNVKYIEESIFFKLIEGKLTQKKLINNLNEYVILNDFLLENKHDFNIEKVTNTHNSINNLTSESEEVFYDFGNMYDNVELFLLISIIDKKYEEIIKSAFKFLKDRGFGKRITTGNGQFDYEITSSDINTSYDDYYITLSRYIPKDEEIRDINDNCSYKLVEKQGKFSNGELKIKTTFFEEGSVFNTKAKNPGKVIQSGVNQNSIEYGYAFPIKYSRGYVDEV